MLHFHFENAPASFGRPLRVVEARSVDEVVPALREIERATDAGCYAAGFVSYEAAAAFHAMRIPAHRKMPLLWFGIYAEKLPSPPPDSERGETFALTDWTPAIDLRHYKSALARIRHEIARGNTYQVNYTFPLRARFSGSPLAFHRRLMAAQKARYGAFIDTGRFCILSASPELFFNWRGSDGLITTKPMKGTAPRGSTPSGDRANRERLARSQKNRAENLMIVDLMRNDLGRIAETGSVAAGPLFEIETYPTVFQMTSTVSARTRPGAQLADVFAALFPCGSVTGAPKTSTMRIISEIETAPREVYCGAMGYITPAKDAVFNVPIRTCWIDTQTGEAEYSVGGGITWSSTPRDEYAECFSKARMLLNAAPPGFYLLESLRLENGVYARLDAHLARLARAAAHFAYPADRAKIKAALDQHAREHGAGLRKARLLVAQDGEITIESSAIAPMPSPQTACLATQPIISQNDFLRHKTTHRPFYPESARRGHFSCLHSNERGELTEFSTGNLVLEIAGKKFTPPVTSGLLPGVMRAHLLQSGEVRERVLRIGDLERAGRIWFVNSVRGWVEVRMTRDVE